MDWTFAFKIIFYNEDSEEAEEEGLVTAEDFVAATATIKSWYGNDIIALNISCVEEVPVIITPSGFVDRYVKWADRRDRDHISFEDFI